MPNCRCPLARWQHIDVWLGECQKCGREMEFNVKMDGEDGHYYAYWNRHACEADGDPLLLGEITWSSRQTLTSLRERVAELLVLAK